MRTYYVSSAIPYANSVPHLGFALEIVQTDVLARYHRLKGEDVFFLTGTDEHALKNVLAARELGIKVKELIDGNAQKFRELKNVLNLSWDDFIRTTEPRHVAGVQKFWSSCKKEDIYKKEYKGLYCIGCEEFKTEKELIDEFCPEHPTARLEVVEEENYFFRLSFYQDRLEQLIRSNTIEIVPHTRKNEMLSFINQGLKDFSISRLKERAYGWGISVPGDDSQVLYVWFDALTNYITALGYADNSEKFQRYWQNGDSILHVIGKGVSRFHAIYWPAMLLSAGVQLPKQIFIHGYLTVDSQKISKSLGNVISPSELVEKYGIDPVRYYLLREIPAYNDGDFSYEKFENRYNGDLANGLGNFTARVLTLAEKEKFEGNQDLDKKIEKEIQKTKELVNQKLEEFKFHEALMSIWELISYGDIYINNKEPWKKRDSKVMFNLVVILDNVASLLKPFLPQTSEKIAQSIKWKDNVLRIKKLEILFPRL